jgi:hypothetical protein
VVALVPEVLELTGPSYRPLGDRRLIGALVAGIPALVPVGTFGWMDCWRAATPRPGPTTARWLPDAAPGEVAALLEAGFPASHAKPGVAGVERWAGVRDAAGDRPACGGGRVKSAG